MPTVHQTTDTRMANPAHHNCNDATNGTSVTSPTTPAAACPPALQLPQPCATGPHQHNARASTAGSHCPNIQPQHGTRQPAGGQQQAFNCDMQDWMGHKVCSAHTASWLGEPAASPLAVCTVLSSAPPPPSTVSFQVSVATQSWPATCLVHTAFGFVQAGGLDNNERAPVQPLCPTNSPSAQQAAQQPCVR